ncbi:MAG: hypothetical protein ABIT01_01685 [Thermoanaerobaculia bacterium]
MCRTQVRFAIIAGALATLASAAPVFAQVKPEGYDPLRQITKQLVKANLLIVLDTTGSMAGDAPGNQLLDGADSTGRISWWRSGPVNTPDPLRPGNGSDGNVNPGFDSKGKPRCVVTGVNNSNQPNQWNKNSCSSYEYQLRFELPSRLASVKTALGNSVSVILSYTAPAANQVNSITYPSAWTATAAGAGAPTKSCTLISPGTLSATSVVVQCNVDFGFYTNTTNPVYKAAPGIPFTAYDAVGVPVGNWGSLAAPTAPKDVIGANATKINWGLVAYSTSRGDCATAELKVKLDTNDSNDVTTLETFFKLTKNGGISAGGGTNTIGALTFAKAVIQAVYKGGTITDHANVQTTFAADPRYNCNRAYGVILATDGLSNNCNPKNPANLPSTGANGDWIYTCGACPGPTCCDATSSGYDCPNAWASFAAARADEIWNLNLGSAAAPPVRKGSPINPRVWTIGVSQQVGPCELDFIAYMGRTDADSPNGDAGFGGYHATDNPNLPNPATTVPVTGIPSTYDGPNGRFQASKSIPQPFNPGTNSHGNNAFFSTSPQAISNAFDTIINATALGDYTTNAPTSGASVGSGNIVLLPSSEFPSWKGHLYQYLYDFTKLASDPLFQVLKLDAGQILTNTAASARKIYTWDNNNNLVPVDAAHLSSLVTIASANGLVNANVAFTNKVVDFIRGNNGMLTNTSRPWKLGPLMNTTPAITGRPFAFKQTLKVQSHLAFETKYQDRNVLAWVGSDDGMMHAFRFDTMAEELAILPPDLLPRQVQLFNNYDPVKNIRVTGQPDQVSSHLYGVASSLRYTDVYFQTGTVPGEQAGYHTVGFLTEGPGGTTIAALDITHPSAGDASQTPNIAADKNYDSNEPVKILWSKTGGSGAGQLNGLNPTWSVPALAATAFSNWSVIFGSGANPSSLAGSQVSPSVFTLDMSTSPLNPTVSKFNLANISSGALVGNQAFAASVIFSTAAPAYYSDNVADLGLQADLNGRIWFSTGTNLGSTPYIGIDATAVAGKSQPLYYPPAVSGYGSKPAPKGCDLFAFGSGSFYEKNPDVSETLPPNDIGTGAKFFPSVYLAVNPKPLLGNAPTAVPSAQVVRIPLAGTSFSNGAVNPSFFDLGIHTQLTAPPFLIVPLSGTPGTDPAQALFIVYDPDKGCNGNAYVISITFNLGATCGDPLVVTSKVAYNAGAGAASGFTIVNDVVAVAKSGIGKNENAGLFVTEAKVHGGSSQQVQPLWWKELK